MSESRLLRSRPVALALGLSSVVALLVVRRGFWRTAGGELRASLFDDAMISMSYARTLADGHGLVWFPGADRVEGFTNLSWTLLMAALHRIGLDPTVIVVVIMVLGLACVWATAAIGLMLQREFGLAGARPTFFVVAVVAANFPLLFWAVRGMEVGLVTMLALLAALLVWRLADGPSRFRAIALAATVALGVVTRTDFVVVVVALGCWALVTPAARRVRLAVPLLGGAAAAVVATTAFRLWYFDRPFPNTYYLKLEGVSLFDRLERGLLVDGVMVAAYLLPSVLLILVGWHRLDDRQRSLGRLLAILAAAHVAYSTYAGGDAWELFLIPNRYLTPAVVCLALLATLVTFAPDGVATAPADGTATAGRGTAPALGVLTDRPALVLTIVAIGPLVTMALGSQGQFRSGQPASSLVLPALVLAVAGCLVAALLTIRPTAAVRRAVPAMFSLALLGTLVFRVPQVLHDDGNFFSELGDQLTSLTTPEATIAVTGAGGTQYWSERRAVDLLGKSDRVIAEGPPSAPWVMPGHDKWNLEHSIEGLRPDAIVHGGVAGGLDEDWLDDLGYVPVIPTEGRFTHVIAHRGRSVIYVLRDSPHVTWERLRTVE